MKKEPFVLAFDLGTGGVKAVLVSTAGRVLKTATENYPLYTPGPDMAEQDAEDYWQGLLAATRAVFASGEYDPAGCVGLAIGAMWRGIIPVDGAGKPLCRGMIWLDARAGAEAEELNARFGAALFSSIAYWPKLLWLKKHHPDVIEKADMILEANAFLKLRLTGRATSDVSNCFVSSFDPVIDDFYQKVLDYIGIPRSKFPPRVRCDEQVGVLTSEAAALLGLPVGVPVFGGSGDIPAIAIGAGCAAVGGTHIYLGSSGWVGYCVPHTSDELYISGFDEQRDVALFGFQSIGLSYRLGVEQLYAAEFAERGEAIFQEVDRQVGEIPAGSCGVFATPWFYGEHAPLAGPDARGCYLNLGPNTDRRHMMRALMEGVCYGFSLAMEVKHAQKGYPIPQGVRVVGGGAKSDVWMQMLADVLNMPVSVVAESRHCGAVGIAYHVLVGLGYAKGYEQAATNAPVRAVFTPNPENVPVYQKGRRVYAEIYRALAPVFAINR